MNILSADAVLNVTSRFETSTTSRQVIFIEDTLTNWQQLAELLPASAEVVVLKGAEDGLAQMAGKESAMSAFIYNDLEYTLVPRAAAWDVVVLRGGKG